jgi:succinate-semialdehyde dehydrogenase/glutarate-semialdehyde dehydrogenase
VPAGLFSVITSKRSSDIGKEFCENPLIRKLTFTGSTEVGRILLKQAADQILKCSMELGGNAPFIVFDDADLDAAVEGAMISKFRNNGQTCVCANRIYVQAGVYDAFAKKLTAAVEKLNDRRRAEGGRHHGPADQRGGGGQGRGAYRRCAGKRRQGRHRRQAARAGRHLLPADGRDRGEAGHEGGAEETFGPLAPLFKFDTEEEVIELANATIFGLASYFYARDIGRITRVQEALEYGMVGVNTGLISNEMAPFGGVKQSGLGREGSRATGSTTTWS